ncbi:MAG: conjugal transfer protein [Clostridia bacterium]|nr:conjugal transfer protein [Clostridia bacterium]
MKVKIKKQKVFDGKERLPRNNTGVKKIFRWALLGFIIVIFLRGIGTFFNSDAAHLNSLINKMENYLENPPETLIDDLALQAAAEEIVFEYLTYSGNKEERNRRVNAFMFGRINESFGGDIKLLKPIDIQVTDVEVIKASEVCITLQAKYQVTKEKGEGEKKITYDEDKKSYYKVVVVRDSTGIKVKDVPLLIPTPNQAENYDRRVVKYASVEMAERTEIDESLKSFYKAYYEGNANDISYLTTIKGLKGLENQAKFIGLDKTDARIGEDGTAYVTSKINVQDDLKTYSQQYEIVLVKPEDKYLVSSIDLMNKEFTKHYEEDLENE